MLSQSTIQYKNFEPDDLLQSQVMKMRNNLYASIPSCFHIFVMFEKKAENFNGYVSIDTREKTHVAYASHSNPLISLNEVQTQLSKQVTEDKRGSYVGQFKQSC